MNVYDYEKMKIETYNKLYRFLMLKDTVFRQSYEMNEFTLDGTDGIPERSKTVIMLNDFKELFQSFKNVVSILKEVQKDACYSFADQAMLKIAADCFRHCGLHVLEHLEEIEQSYQTDPGLSPNDQKLIKEYIKHAKYEISELYNAYKAFKNAA